MDEEEIIKDISSHMAVRVGSKDSLSQQGGRPMQLGLWQLWRSLPRPCKLFLLVCLVQSTVSGAFAAVELSKSGSSNLQDLILILISSIYFFGLVLDAFWHENGYQLLVCMASGALNLVQLIVYASSLRAGRDGASVGVVVACALLQAIAVGLARWAYLGFGWRMYSKIAGDMRLPDIDRRRHIGLRLDRFSALAKLDVQLLCLMLVVGVVNGSNPSGSESLTPLLIVAAVGVTGATTWLVAAWTAVAAARPRLSLAAEFTYPLCYIIAAAYMFSSVYYGSRLAQIHGQVYLVVIPVIFVAWRTTVWWDARLLAASGLLAGPQRQDIPLPHRRGGGAMHMNDLPGITPAPGKADSMQHVQQETHVPAEILPLVHGAWLLKLPSVSTSSHASPTKRILGFSNSISAAGGRWRYFQLSHDGSTLRWDWRKYVLLLHVESVSANTQDLTITLSLTLEPDLRLRFPDQEIHATWARGLTLLVMLLGNPDGLEGRDPKGVSIGNKDVGYGTTAGFMVVDPGSPSRLLHRLASASARASAAGLLTKEALQAAAWQARKALGDHSEPVTPLAYEDIEKGGGVEVEGDRTVKGHTVISMHATSLHGTAGLRQRTPTVRHLSNSSSRLPAAESQDSDQRMQHRDSTHRPLQRLPGEGSPSPSKQQRKPERAASWLRRTLTAPVSTLATGVSRQLAFGDGSNPWNNVDTAEDLEARGCSHPAPTYVPPVPHSTTTVVPVPPHRPRHLRSASLGSEGIAMPPVPEGCRASTPALAHPHPPPLPSSSMVQQQQQQLQSSTLPFNGNGAPRVGSGTGGVYHMVAVAGRVPVRGKSSSPASGGKGGPTPTRGTSTRIGGSPLKPATTALQSTTVGPPGPSQPLERYSSAPIHLLHNETYVPEAPESAACAAATTQQGHVGGSRIHRVSSDASSWQVDSVGSIVRYDSLGAQWAPESKLWQAMFDAGMLANCQGGQGMAGGSTEGSPSPTATPRSVHSMTRSVSVNVELIDFDQLSFGRMLGEGAEGPVYAAWFQETPVAVKRASCPTEVDLHLHAGWHDNVVNLRGLAQHGGHTHLVMELCPRGTLDMLIHQGSASANLDPAKLLPIVRSIARGMLHLHTRSPPVMHRDLKPANIFIGHGFVMKIGDFGMARYAADTRAARAAQAHISPSKFGSGAALLRTLTPGVIGTAAYCAPELLQPQTPKAGDAFDADVLLKADVYSFGVLLWELLERKRPYAEMDGFQIQTQWVLDAEAMKLKPPKVQDGLTPASKRVMQTLALLVQKCTGWDPSDRPTFKEILATLRAAAVAGPEGEAPPTPVRRLVSPF